MFCPTSIIGLRFGKEGLYCLLYEQPKNKNTYPLCKKHTHYIMPLLQESLAGKPPTLVLGSVNTGGESCSSDGVPPLWTNHGGGPKNKKFEKRKGCVRIRKR